MAIPKNVQRQLEAAEAAAAQTLAAPPAPVVDQPPAPAEPVAQTPPPAPAPSVDWEQRFRTVDGMYKAEVPRMRAQTAALESQVVSLTEQVRAMTEALKKAPKEPEKSQPDPRDVETFGQDLVAMVQRYAERAAQELNVALRGFDERVSRLESAVTGVDQRSTQTLEQQFYATLDSAIPNWRDINERPEWLTWLAEEDDLSGVTRQTVLTSAHERLDAKRVIAVFKKFLASRPEKPSLEGQVTPAVSAPAPAPVSPTGKPLMSLRAVEKFYDELAKGRYRGREAEAAQMEAEISAAQREGRIAMV